MTHADQLRVTLACRMNSTDHCSERRDQLQPRMSQQLRIRRYDDRRQRHQSRGHLWRQRDTPRREHVGGQWNGDDVVARRPDAVVLFLDERIGVVWTGLSDRTGPAGKQAGPVPDRINPPAVPDLFPDSSGWATSAPELVRSADLR